MRRPLTRAAFLRTISRGQRGGTPKGSRPIDRKGSEMMKAHIPKHREFIINLAEDYEKKDECWAKLQEIMKAYQKEGKSVYTPTFIEDNEDKVKALQAQYEFTYTVEER